jgi:deoxyadenosine/deoxycytidine kinase
LTDNNNNNNKTNKITMALINDNILVSLEGNIGSGKTTLLKYLEETNQNSRVIFLKEPVEEWEKIVDKEGNTMLKKFYENQEKYSFPFQMMAYISRLANLKKTMEQNHNCIIISERSLYTDRYVFAKMLYESGKIEDVNYKIYLTWFDTFADDYPVQKIIYVNTKPELCHERIKKRSRTGEDSIPLDYLNECHKYHKEMMNILKEPKLIIDGNVDIYENKEKIKEWKNSILNFVRM